MRLSHKVVLFDDPDHPPDEGARMEFRLTYAGPLYATQRDAEGSQKDKRAHHKHNIRTVFQKQLRKLWSVYPPLDENFKRPRVMVAGVRHDEFPPTSVESISKRYSMYGFNFVPLVTEQLSLLCGLEILFLRNRRPGDILISGNYGGDLDNRIKTLLDTLSIPSANEDYARLAPGQDETPFFCLLEDDKLVSKISVETDQLLEDINGGSENDVRLLIRVSVRPYDVNLWNIHLS